jgi:hypothetical protein
MPGKGSSSSSNPTRSARRPRWQDVADHVAALTPDRARAIGRAALARILAEHTYAHRGALVDQIFRAAVPPGTGNMPAAEAVQA